MKNNKNKREIITFCGNKITDINTEIAIYLGQWKEGEDPCNIPNFEIGEYRGKKIYQIKNKLFWVSKDSWTCNSQYCWYLKETTSKCYQYLKKEK